jgi:hypothetical protein
MCRAKASLKETAALHARFEVGAHFGVRRSGFEPASAIAMRSSLSAKFSRPIPPSDVA